MTAPNDPTDEVNAVVLNYLRKMGYRQTEQLFKEEAHVAGLDAVAYELRNDQDASITNYLLFAGGPGQEVATSFAAYEQSYQKLVAWCHESLDVYRDELCQVLYPIAVHCYLDLVAKGHGNDAARFLALMRGEHEAAHGDELAKLEAVREPGQIRESSVAAAFRSNKYNLSMSAFVFQLLMSFLQEGASLAGGVGSGGNILLLKIINQFINIRVLVHKAGIQKGPGGGVVAGATVTGITGLPPQASLTLNRQPIKWGVRAYEPEAEEALQSLKPKDPAGRPLLNDPMSQSLALYKKIFAAAEGNLPAAEGGVPKAEMGPTEVSIEVERLRELSQRALLSSTSLPSICCYTLHNAYEGITSLDISMDGTLMASGHRDSFIDLWSLTNEPLKTIKPSTELAAMDLSTIGDDLDVIREPVGSVTKRLVGHSGPVYSTKFMGPTGKHFMISASQDKTLRLWSLDLFSSVVLYKSHTLPVWDVDVPFGANAGPYFVSASADRTARLWSTDHIHPLRIFAGHLSDVDCCRFHPNGNYVATGSSDKTVRLWDIQSGSCVRLLTGHERGVTAMAISPDGRILASGDRLGHVKLWDLGEGKLLKAMAPQSLLNTSKSAGSSNSITVESPVYSLSFCQEGKILASAGADGCVNLWDAAKAASPTLQVDSQLHLASYPTKQTPLYYCQFSRRNILLTAGVFSPDF